MHYLPIFLFALTATAASAAVLLVVSDGPTSRRAVALLLMRLALVFAGALTALLQAGTSGLSGG